jgi:uncharacterized RDD family membrane protein YckC
VSPAEGRGTIAAPPLLRRLLCMVYEGVLLFGVVMLAGLLYAGLTQQRHALQGQSGLRIFLLVVLGAYFVGFWTRGGQTLAMKTWHIRLLSADGRPVGLARATARYLMSWLWFLPALLLLHLSGLVGTGATLGVVGAGMAVYAALSRLHPSRQFWHDVACGTRLADVRPPKDAKPPREKP